MPYHPKRKGKIERPYRWMQDRMVRTCAREGIKTVEEGQVDAYHKISIHNLKLKVHKAPLRK